MIKPALVFPFHDPEGIYFEHLKTILPFLKQSFSAAYLSIPPGTRSHCPSNVAWLQSDQFFQLHLLPCEMPVGQHFLSLYEYAAAASPPHQILHLCFVDRLAFALQTHHRDQFIADVNAVTTKRAPLIFQRSPTAWRTHPRNYYEIERIATVVGEILLGKILDFAWCHLAIQAGELQSLLQRVERTQNDDMSITAELVLLSASHINTQGVEWLEWEDPFFSTEDAAVLKQLREGSVAESDKRLAYIVPMLQKIFRHSHNAKANQ